MPRLNLNPTITDTWNMDNTNRADMLWRTLAGLFGADSLERKYGKSPPREWVGLLRTLKDFELERGLRRLPFSGKPHVPTLPEFLRLCREVGSDQFPDEQRTPVDASRQIAHQPLPRWEMQANQHLLAHLMRRTLDKIPTTEAMMPHYHTARLAWASDMRDAEAAEEIPADNGQKWFRDYIANADRATA
jgi:hypothetical protein